MLRKIVDSLVDPVKDHQKLCFTVPAAPLGAEDNLTYHEATLRQILSDTLAPERGNQPNLADAIRRRFAPLGGVDLDPHPRVPVGEPPEFDR